VAVQFVFSVINADVFTRIQELKNEACARMAPPPRSPIHDTRHTHVRATSPSARGEDIAPIDWSNPQQLKEFFGSFSRTHARTRTHAHARTHASYHARTHG
jgi:hypothetical protein